MQRVGLNLIAVALAAPAAHAQAVFTEAPITVEGHRNVRATWINDGEAITATIYDTSNQAAAGVVLQGVGVTYLKPPYSGSEAAQPQQIDDAGNVLGYAQYQPLNIPQMFLLRNGEPDRNYDIALIEPFGTQGLTIPNPIGFAAGKIIFYTEVLSLSAPTDPTYGVPPNLHQAPQYNQFQTIRSVNAHGMVAGTSYPLSGRGSVFFGRGAEFSLLVPPGATSSAGGYINAADAVAGSYVDAAGVPHGFVYANGVYRSFDMPTSAQSISVTGLSDTGRVVGSYASAGSGTQHAFRYNGATTAAFGTFAAYDAVSVALNAGNAMVVAVQIGTGGWRSGVVRCGGSGC